MSAPRWKTVKTSKTICIKTKKRILLKLQYSPDWDEYRVAVFIEGVFNEAKTYYCCDEADASDTLTCMIKEFEDGKTETKKTYID